MILLSFDIEEFDTLKKFISDVPFAEQIRLSIIGSHLLLDVLANHNVKATFFTTAIFAQHAPEITQRIVSEGHELASHGYHHSSFNITDLALSKITLEKLTGQAINGYRMPNMRHVDEVELGKAGYLYDSSISPTWLPGRYNNLHKPKTHFKQHDLWRIPTSVTPFLRVPLFWLTFHNLPLSIYYRLAKRTIKKNNYLNIYFHPWEFLELNQYKHFGMPHFVARNTGIGMMSRMNTLITKLKKDNYAFLTFTEFINTLNQ